MRALIPSVSTFVLVVSALSCSSGPPDGALDGLGAPNRSFDEEPVPASTGADTEDLDEVYANGADAGATADATSPSDAATGSAPAPATPPACKSNCSKTGYDCASSSSLKYCREVEPGCLRYDPAFACPASKPICDRGVCQPPPVCGASLYCSFGTLSGASRCTSNGNVLWCCPAGKQIVGTTCQ